jgi:predicted amino acid dehydrogenase
MSVGDWIASAPASTARRNKPSLSAVIMCRPAVHPPTRRGSPYNRSSESLRRCARKVTVRARRRTIILLKNKNAIICGAAGAAGSAVAHAFAREGARVFLTGRTLSKVEGVANEIRKQGPHWRSAR